MLPTLYALWPGNLNSMSWQVRHPVLMTMEQVGDELPRPLTLNKYCGYFLSIQAMSPLCVSVTIKGTLITYPARRGGSRVMV